MKLLSVCCVLFTITVTATCLQRDSRYQQVLARKSNKKIIKRDASLLIDTSPIDIDPVYRMPEVISYRRLARSKLSSKPKQPPRLYKSAKKYKKPAKPKHGSPSYKKKTQKPRYYRKRPTPNNLYAPPPRYAIQYSPNQAEPAGFGEPPEDFRNVYPPRPAPPYKEKLIDSYGSPIQPDLDDFPPHIHASQFNKELDSVRPSEYSWQNFPNQNSDNIYAFSKKRPTYERPEHEAQDIDDLSYNDFLYRSQSKPNYNLDPNKYARPPWKVKSKREREVEDEIIVGGQYAEPPARYVPKFQPSAPMFDNGEDFAPPHRLIDPEITVSATNSPYVNYKHSNMAFSPQNLNDAFSIVEK